MSVHPDDLAVDAFAARMKEKLASARAKGRGGWDDPAQCSVPHLQQLLHEHIAKGDPVDVANFCMMLAHYCASTILSPHHADRDEVAALKRKVEMQAEALQRAREDVLEFLSEPDCQREGSDADWVGHINAALAS